MRRGWRAPLQRDIESRRRASGVGAANSTFTIEGDWDSQFKQFIGRLGGLSTSWRRASVTVQNRAARIIALLYKEFIRQGIEPENSALTQILTGVHPPLSGLADYIIVVESNAERGQSTYPGRPKPALVTWHPDWATIAFLHDRGYSFIPTQQQRDALFNAAAKIAGGKKHFLEEGFSTQGIWIIPARPHAHFLRSPEMDRVLKVVAIDVIKAEENLSSRDRRPPNEPWKPRYKKNIDDMRNL
jgi:hypothetical protein